MFKRIWALFQARNIESIRDRSSLIWNIFFPLALLVGFSVFFSGQGKVQYQIGVVGQWQQQSDWQPLWNTPYLSFDHYRVAKQAEGHLARHQLDLVVDPSHNRYWVNPKSPKSVMAEKVLEAVVKVPLTAAKLSSQPIRYVDWFLPGVLGMNVMFSGLWGVGYAIVRYRKNGVLKRLSATPVRPIEFLLAQVCSRLVLIMAITVILFICATLFLHLTMRGSVLVLFVIFMLGATSMISLGLLLASRSKSEELTAGLVNLISWPMMFLSQVWFSLEGAPHWLKYLADLLPLTQVIHSARQQMLYGTMTTTDWLGLAYVAVFTVVCLALGAWRFRWR
ncbi:ABC transporter permease [Celerinatantimonas sp. MCCC 1A17872]|uniref:ABC transporter permease n=1 Tax=Celerinatantimonas sp. MCCC 1A17872 TaxID=3177514 RepID=UPI0038C90414